MKAEKIERYIRSGGKWIKHEWPETDIEELHNYADLDGIRLVSEIVTENGRLMAKIVGWYRPDVEEQRDRYADFDIGYHAGYMDGKRRGYIDGCNSAGIRLDY